MFLSVSIYFDGLPDDALGRMVVHIERAMCNDGRVIIARYAEKVRFWVNVGLLTRYWLKRGADLKGF